MAFFVVLNYDAYKLFLIWVHEMLVPDRNSSAYLSFACGMISMKLETNPFYEVLKTIPILDPRNKATKNGLVFVIGIVCF